MAFGRYARRLDAGDLRIYVDVRTRALGHWIRLGKYGYAQRNLKICCADLEKRTRAIGAQLDPDDTHERQLIEKISALIGVVEMPGKLEELRALYHLPTLEEVNLGRTRARREPEFCLTPAELDGEERFWQGLRRFG